MGGYANWTELLEANDAYCLNSDLDYLSNFAAAPDDMMQLTIIKNKDSNYVRGVPKGAPFLLKRNG